MRFYAPANANRAAMLKTIPTTSSQWNFGLHHMLEGIDQATMPQKSDKTPQATSPFWMASTHIQMTPANPQIKPTIPKTAPMNNLPF